MMKIAISLIAIFAVAFACASEDGSPEPYSYSYVDPTTSQGKTEKSDGNTVTGYYFVNDNENGHQRRVDYIADANGFRANVQSNHDEVAQRGPQHHRHQHQHNYHHQANAVPVGGSSVGSSQQYSVPSVSYGYGTVPQSSPGYYGLSGYGQSPQRSVYSSTVVPSYNSYVRLTSTYPPVYSASSGRGLYGQQGYVQPYTSGYVQPSYYSSSSGYAPVSSVSAVDAEPQKKRA